MLSSFFILRCRFIQLFQKLDPSICSPHLCIKILISKSLITSFPQSADGHRSCSYVKDLFFTTSKLVGTYQVIVN